jgi:hypothetical protein
MKEVPINIAVMDISQNLARIGNWTADSFDEKRSLIERFLTQTEEYVQSLSKRKMPKELAEVFLRFKKEFVNFKIEKFAKNRDEWAEKALTWANILQNRASIT